MTFQSTGNKKIAKNTVALYTRMGITMFISFFTTRITLEILGVEDFGLNNVVASVVTMFGFINGSMGTAVQRFFSIEIGKNNHSYLARVFGTGLYLHTIVAGITFILTEIFALFFLSKLNIPAERLFAAHIVFQISIISLVLNIVNVPFQALLRAHEEFSKIAILDVFQAILKLVVLFLLYQIQYDKLIIYSLLNFTITVIYISIIVVFAKKYNDAKFKLNRDKELMKEMLSFISMLLFTVLASVLDKQGIVVLVNLFFGLTINAGYAIAFQASQILDTFAMNFKQAVVPQLMQSYGANDTRRVNKLIFMGTKVTFFLMILISIPVIFESEYILKIWLKEPPKFASKFTILILISTNINTFSYFVYQAVHASGKIKMQQILTTASYLFSVLTIYLVFNLGGNFYYAVYIPIVFSIVRNWIIVHCAKVTIALDVKFYLNQVIGRSFLLVIFLGIPSMIIIQLLDESFLRLLTLFAANAISLLIGGYFLLFDSMERKTIVNIVSSSVLSFSNRK
jgi:O-antigen/teichoic acid export membrane protein